MKFHDIAEDDQIVPGEFLLHIPTKSIVVCGAYDGVQIRALDGGKLFKDKIDNFKKIQITARERKTRYVPTCKGCSG